MMTLYRDIEQNKRVATVGQRRFNELTWKQFRADSLRLAGKIVHVFTHRG